RLPLSAPRGAMDSPPRPLVPPPLDGARVEPDAAVAARLAGAGGEARTVRSVWVSDLLDPRIAYYRAISPVEPSPDVIARRESGREAHDRVERRLAAPEHREIRVGADGIVGRIDLLYDRPTELKSTAKLLEPAELPRLRPSYVEQLAAYCALLERPTGRLLLVRDATGGTADLRVGDAEFSDLPGLRRELLTAAEALRQAIRDRNPDPLARCAWFGRGCEYQEAGVCHCTGQEPSPPGPGVRRLIHLERNLELEHRVAEQLAAPPPDPSTEPIGKYNDLLYPRQTFFERTGAPRRPGAPFSGGPLWRELRDVVESELASELDERGSTSGEPREPVACFRGEPYLLKTSRSRWRTLPEQVPLRSPHYLLDLALRAGALRVEGGWIFLARERPEPGAPRIEALHVRFSEAPRLAVWLDGQVSALHAAVREGDPSRLPACPEWRFEECPYRDFCGDPQGRAAPSRPPEPSARDS
ncbi:MAG TPA: hypothetical protein VGU43_02145, partial [Thermoplasmata archaeon]|nr:hypothetical protein [Thermoplasmata archaeon]